MAKALFFGLPLHGHTNPSLPLVRALVDRGEEIVYFSAEGFAARIQEAGARFQPYRNAFLADLRQLPGQTNEIAWLLMRATGEVLAADLAAFKAEEPDYVIADSVAPWGQWAGQVLDVPVVTSVTTCVVNRHVLAFAAARDAAQECASPWPVRR
jgi:UDP:flavonoid glycosyltransferase YjiC (YdhE family)